MSFKKLINFLRNLFSGGKHTSTIETKIEKEVVLKKVGFFKELDYGYPECESIKDSVSNNKLANQADIIDYLAAGHVLIASGGLAADYFNETANSGYPHIITDGAWVWPGTLAYYIENYHVGLPDEFINHMKKGKWLSPMELEVESMLFDNMKFEKDEDGDYGPVFE